MISSADCFWASWWTQSAGILELGGLSVDSAENFMVNYTRTYFTGESAYLQTDPAEFKAELQDSKKSHAEMCISSSFLNVS